MISAKNCRGRVAGRGVGVAPRQARGDVLSCANADILNVAQHSDIHKQHRRTSFGRA